MRSYAAVVRCELLGGERLLIAAAATVAVAVGVSRVFLGAHWPTDVVFSIFGGWLLIGLLGFGLILASAFKGRP